MTAPNPALVQLVSRGEASADIEDEESFLRSVAEHRMTSAVLAGYQQGALPLSAAAGIKLGIWELAEGREHLRFWETIAEVEARLAPLGAAVAVLKGVATEARWYDALGQRVSTDVDLLLAPSDLDHSAEIVNALDPDRANAPAIDWLVRRRLLQHVDTHVRAIDVDLHFDPFKIGLPTRQLDEVWGSTQMLETPQGTIRVLRPEIELVVLLLHLNKDRFAFLGPFLDIRQILDRGVIDWEYLRSFVAAEGLDVPVWKSLAAVVDVLALEVDGPRITGPRGWTWDRLWGPAARLQGDEGRQRAPSIQMFLALHASGRPGDVVRETRRRLNPPRQLFEVAGRGESGPYRRYWRVVSRPKAESL